MGPAEWEVEEPKARRQSQNLYWFPTAAWPIGELPLVGLMFYEDMLLVLEYYRAPPLNNGHE